MSPALTHRPSYHIRSHYRRANSDTPARNGPKGSDRSVNKSTTVGIPELKASCKAAGRSLGSSTFKMGQFYINRVGSNSIVNTGGQCLWRPDSWSVMPQREVTTIMRETIWGCRDHIINDHVVDIIGERDPVFIKIKQTLETA